MVYEDRQVFTVRQVNQAVSDAVAAAFPATLWVRGEVQRLPRDAARRQHVYFELHETGTTGAAEYQVPVSLMGWDRDRYGLGRYLDGTDPDLQLADKLEVCLEVRVDFYAKFGKLSLKIVGVDKTFSLGKLEAARRATLAFLREQGLLEANGAVPLPELPLRVGLITSAGSAAEQDFLTGLVHSGWAFSVVAAPAKMQGDRVQAEVTAGLARLARAGVDVIVITRGGGSRADLSWFDQRDLAVAIARCPVPVITAIGHEIDRSIADEVAHQACKTPTAAAEFLVDRIDRAAARLDEAAARLRDAALDLLEDGHRRLDVRSRLKAAVERRQLAARVQVQGQGGRLQRRVADRLGRSQQRLAGQGTRLAVTATRRVSGARGDAGRLAARLGAGLERRLQRAASGQDQLARQLGREAPRRLEAAAKRLAAFETQARLLDPARLLARGYSWTLGPDGRLLRKAADAAPGDVITTRLADGALRSIVQPGDGQPAKKPARPAGGRRRGPGEEPGQGNLF
jgi:exodeoxyribonuclease VII large subunit